ncbi:MAG: hypothetical protein RIB98_13905 [Acidimicrobiales bacterium]
MATGRVARVELREGHGFADEAATRHMHAGFEAHPWACLFAPSALLTAHHDGGGDLHPEALGKAERLQVSPGEVINALNKHEHLAMDSDDVWHALTRKHGDHDVPLS